MGSKKHIIIIGAVVLLAVLFYSVFGTGSKRIDWRELYHREKLTPYSISILYELMDGVFEDKQKVEITDSLHIYLTDEKNTGTYFYLGSRLWLDSLRINAILDFVKRGNDAFIITPGISLELLDSINSERYSAPAFAADSLYYDEYNMNCFIEDSLAKLNFTHPRLMDTSGYVFNFRYKNEDVSYAWRYLPPGLFSHLQTVFTPLGTINDTLVNFAKAKYGDGWFYFHTTPLAFTNFHIIKKRGREYVEKTLSHLKKPPLLWDVTKMSFEFPGLRRNGAFSETPLKYILSQPPLAWAWYLLLGMAILYLAFRAKRRQRIIPVLEKNENTSLEFINTIGRLYFIQNNHRQLALENRRLFLGYVREHYKIPTREINDAFKKQLSVKSEVPLPVIEKIFTLYENIERSGFISENTLVLLYQKMEQFYQNCK